MDTIRIKIFSLTRLHLSNTGVVGILILITNLASIASQPEYRGKVVEVNDGKVVAEFEQSEAGKPGDLLRIAMEVPRVGLLDLEGRWRVIRVEGRKVSAEAVGETDQPLVGQVAFLLGRENSRQVASDISNRVPPGEQEPSNSEEIPLLPSVPSPGQIPSALDGTEQGILIDPETAPTSPTANAVDYLTLGRSYAFPNKGEPNYEAAVPYLRKAAEMGSVLGAFELAWIYLQDKSVVDQKEALQWLQKAADQQHPDAEFLLGLLYEGEFDVFEPNLHLASKWLRRASAHGHPEAKKRLMNRAFPEVPF